MENKETSETLGEGFIEAKLNQAEILCNVEERNPFCLNNLNEKCVTDVYSLESEISHVELASKYGDVSFEESIFGDVAGNNEINKGFLNDDKLSVMICDDVNNNDVPFLEGGLNFSGSNGIRIGKADETVEECDSILHSHELEKVDEPIEEGDHVLHPHEPGSPTKLEVSGNNINLFVEVFGPLNGVSESSDNLDGTREDNLGEGESDQEYPLEENGTISPGVKEEIGKNEEGDIVEYTFKSGDLVWAKTRTKSWWPGMISGTPDAANGTTMSEKGVSFLVKYYGNPSFVWCHHSDLKPFVDYFDQMSGQNNTRMFSCLVKKILCEIGQRVKSKMTCPCFTKESTINKEEISVLAEGDGEFDVLSLSQFEPATFIGRIKNLASSAKVQSRIELVVMQNRLSSFYCSMGHCDLPLHLLVNDGEEVNNDDVTRTKKRNRGEDGDNKASSGKGWESRERKKSKYLSYPYVDVIQAKEDPNNPSSINTKPTPQSSSRKGGAKKPLKERHVVSKADDIDACSSELLAEVCSAARDCFYLRESKYSDSLKGFYSSFRVFAFQDVDITCKDSKGQKEGDKVVKKSKKQKANPVKENVENVAGPNTDNQPVKEKVKKTAKKKKEEATNSSQKEVEGIGVVKESGERENGVCSNAKKKKKRVIPASLESIQTSLNIGTNISPNVLGTNISPNVSGIISFGQTCSNVPKSGAIPGVADISSNASLPDLNGTQTSFSGEHNPVGEPEPRKEALVSPNINNINNLIFTPISSFKSAPVNLQNTPNVTNQCSSDYFPVRESGTDVMKTDLGPFAQYALKMGLFGSTGKPERRKRKRKEKTAQPPPAIPDLNGNVLDTGPLGNSTPDRTHISPEVEPPKKRASKTDIGPNGEPIGGNLLLNFAPGSTLPSKETLVATFSRFGLLKESELQFISDSAIQIAYERSSDARFAFRSMEKSHPFGDSLVDLKSDCLPPPSVKRKKDVKMLRSFSCVDASKNRPRPTEGSDIAAIKRNVEMMKLTLEKAGDNLSSEMRARLEKEIKVFLDKISSIPGSSSG